MARPRKQVDIEKLLQWAFREELPKGLPVSASAWSALDRYCSLGCKIQEDYVGMGMRSSLGVVAGETHPDAKVIGYAVKELQPADIDWEESKAALVPDMMLLAAWSPWLERIATGVLIVSNAVMGSRPAWDIGRPELKKIIAANGKPVVNGEVRRAGEYTLGAYCPIQYVDPTPAEVAAARAEYAVWHAAMCRLAAGLHDKLAEHEALPPACAAEPWRTGEAPKPRILRAVMSIHRAAIAS